MKRQSEPASPAVEDPATWPISRLKAFLTENGVSFELMNEKSQFVESAREALQKKKAQQQSDNNNNDDDKKKGEGKKSAAASAVPLPPRAERTAAQWASLPLFDAKQCPEMAQEIAYLRANATKEVLLGTECGGDDASAPSTTTSTTKVKLLDGVLRILILNRNLLDTRPLLLEAERSGPIGLCFLHKIVMGTDNGVAMQRALTPKSASVAKVCGKTLGRRDMIFRCLECAADPTCVMCAECFNNSPCVNHEYRMSASGGGMCDCGDPSAWKASSFCCNHGGASHTDDPTAALNPADKAWLSAALRAAALQAIVMVRYIAAMKIPNALQRQAQKAASDAAAPETNTECAKHLFDLVGQEASLRATLQMFSQMAACGEAATRLVFDAVAEQQSLEPLFSAPSDDNDNNTVEYALSFDARLMKHKSQFPELTTTSLLDELVREDVRGLAAKSAMWRAHVDKFVRQLMPDMSCKLQFLRSFVKYSELSGRPNEDITKRAGSEMDVLKNALVNQAVQVMTVPWAAEDAMYPSKLMLGEKTTALHRLVSGLIYGLAGLHVNTAYPRFSAPFSIASGPTAIMKYAKRADEVSFLLLTPFHEMRYLFIASPLSGRLMASSEVLLRGIVTLELGAHFSDIIRRKDEGSGKHNYFAWDFQLKMGTFHKALLKCCSSIMKSLPADSPQVLQSFSKGLLAALGIDSALANDSEMLEALIASKAHDAAEAAAAKAKQSSGAKKKKAATSSSSTTNDDDDSETIMTPETILPTVLRTLLASTRSFPRPHKDCLDRLDDVFESQLDKCSASLKYPILPAGPNSSIHSNKNAAPSATSTSGLLPLTDRIEYTRALLAIVGSALNEAVIATGAKGSVAPLTRCLMKRVVNTATTTTASSDDNTDNNSTNNSSKKDKKNDNVASLYHFCPIREEHGASFVIPLSRFMASIVHTFLRAEASDVTNSVYLKPIGGTAGGEKNCCGAADLSPAARRALLLERLLLVCPPFAGKKLLGSSSSSPSNADALPTVSIHDWVDMPVKAMLLQHQVVDQLWMRDFFEVQRQATLYDEFQPANVREKDLFTLQFMAAVVGPSNLASHLLARYSYVPQDDRHVITDAPFGYAHLVSLILTIVGDDNQSSCNSRRANTNRILRVMAPQGPMVHSQLMAAINTQIDDDDEEAEASDNAHALQDLIISLTTADKQRKGTVRKLSRDQKLWAGISCYNNMWDINDREAALREYNLLFGKNTDASSSSKTGGGKDQQPQHSAEEFPRALVGHHHEALLDPIRALLHTTPALTTAIYAVLHRAADIQKQVDIAEAAAKGEALPKTKYELEKEAKEREEKKNAANAGKKKGNTSATTAEQRLNEMLNAMRRETHAQNPQHQRRPGGGTNNDDDDDAIATDSDDEWFNASDDDEEDLEAEEMGEDWARAILGAAGDEEGEEEDADHNDDDEDEEEDDITTNGDMNTPATSVEPSPTPAREDSTASAAAASSPKKKSAMGSKSQSAVSAASASSKKREASSKSLLPSAAETAAALKKKRETAPAPIPFVKVSDTYLLASIDLLLLAIEDAVAIVAEEKAAMEKYPTAAGSSAAAAIGGVNNNDLASGDVAGAADVDDGTVNFILFEHWHRRVNAANPYNSSGSNGNGSSGSASSANATFNSDFYTPLPDLAGRSPFLHTLAKVPVTYSKILSPQNVVPKTSTIAQIHQLQSTSSSSSSKFSAADPTAAREILHDLQQGLETRSVAFTEAKSLLDVLPLLVRYFSLELESQLRVKTTVDKAVADVYLAKLRKLITLIANEPKNANAADGSGNAGDDAEAKANAERDAKAAADRAARIKEKQALLLARMKKKQEKVSATHKIEGAAAVTSPTTATAAGDADAAAKDASATSADGGGGGGGGAIAVAATPNVHTALMMSATEVECCFCRLSDDAGELMWLAHAAASSNVSDLRTHRGTDRFAQKFSCANPSTEEIIEEKRAAAHRVANAGDDNAAPYQPRVYDDWDTERDSADEDNNFTAAKKNQKPLINNTIAFKSDAELKSSEPKSERLSVTVMTCGHAAHMACVEKHHQYLNQQRGRDIRDLHMQRRGFRGMEFLGGAEFCCPLCSKIATVLCCMPKMGGGGGSNPNPNPTTKTNANTTATTSAALAGIPLPPSADGCFADWVAAAATNAAPQTRPFKSLLTETATGFSRSADQLPIDERRTDGWTRITNIGALQAVDGVHTVASYSSSAPPAAAKSPLVLPSEKFGKALSPSYLMNLLYYGWSMADNITMTLEGRLKLTQEHPSSANSASYAMKEIPLPVIANLSSMMSSIAVSLYDDDGSALLGGSSKSGGCAAVAGSSSSSTPPHLPTSAEFVAIFSKILEMTIRQQTLEEVSQDRDASRAQRLKKAEAETEETTVGGGGGGASSPSPLTSSSFAGAFAFASVAKSVGGYLSNKMLRSSSSVSDGAAATPPATPPTTPAGGPAAALGIFYQFDKAKDAKMATVMLPTMDLIELYGILCSFTFAAAAEEAKRIGKQKTAAATSGATAAEGTSATAAATAIDSEIIAALVDAGVADLSDESTFAPFVKSLLVNIVQKQLFKRNNHNKKRNEEEACGDDTTTTAAAPPSLEDERTVISTLWHTLVQLSLFKMLLTGTTPAPCIVGHVRDPSGDDDGDLSEREKDAATKAVPHGAYLLPVGYDDKGSDNDKHSAAAAPTAEVALMTTKVVALAKHLCPTLFADVTASASAASSASSSVDVRPSTLLADMMEKVNVSNTNKNDNGSLAPLAAVAAAYLTLSDAIVTGKNNKKPVAEENDNARSASTESASSSSNTTNLHLIVAPIKTRTVTGELTIIEATKARCKDFVYLPPTYHGYISQVTVLRNCSQCGAKSPVFMCLKCREMFCLRPASGKPEVFKHVQTCSGGVGVLLMIRNSEYVVVSGVNERASQNKAVYVDRYGEYDEQLARGVALNLHAKYIASDLLTPMITNTWDHDNATLKRAFRNGVTRL